MAKARLAALLLGLSLAALLAALGGVKRRPVLTQRQAAAGLARLGANLHRDRLGRVDFVWLTDRPTPDSVLREARPYLAALPSLRVLSLYATPVSGEGLACLRGLAQLRELNLEATGITDQDLNRLDGLPGLEALHLLRTRVTDSGLTSLPRFPRLRSLTLGGAGMTDAGMARLRSLAALRSLVLWGTEVGDAGLWQLRGLPRLRHLHSAYNNGVSESGLARLRQALPGLEVTSLEHW
jgi:hypothetical protein